MDVNLKTHITHQNGNGLRHQKEDIKYIMAMRYVDLLSKYQSIFPFFSHTNLIKLLCYRILQRECHVFAYAVNSSCACCTCPISLRKKEIKGENNNTTNNNKTKTSLEKKATPLFVSLGCLC